MDLTQIGSFLDKYGVATTILAAIAFFIFYKLWPYIMNRSQQDGEREKTLLGRVFDITDAQIKQTSEISKNMAEGNVLLSALSNHMSSTSQGMENIVKRLEISETQINERHQQNTQNMVKMMKQWDDIQATLHKAILQNAGDTRNAAQKLESQNRTQRAKKKPLNDLEESPV